MSKFNRRVSVAGHPILLHTRQQDDDVTASWDHFVNSRDANSWSIFGALKRRMPVTDPTDSVTFDVTDITVTPPTTDPEVCRQLGATYQAEVSATIRTILWGTDAPDDNSVLGTKYVRSVTEKILPVGRVPLMSRGMFVINGSARTSMAQIRRAAGTYFKIDRDADVFKATLMTERGPWTYAKAERRLMIALDRRRGVNAVDFLVYGCGLSVSTVLEGLAVGAVKATVRDGRIFVTDKAFASKLMSRRLLHGFTLDSGEIDLTQQANDNVLCLLSPALNVGGALVGVPGSSLGDAVVSKGAHGEVLVGIYSHNTTLLRTLETSECVDYPYDTIEPMEVKRLVTTAVGGSHTPSGSAMMAAQVLGSVGRFRENSRFSESETAEHVVPMDVLRMCRMLLQAKAGTTKVGEAFSLLGGTCTMMDSDDVDSLENRRVQLAGEAAGRYLDMAMSKIMRGFREDLAKAIIECADPSELIDPARFPAGAVGREIRRYFSSGESVQLADETNPLASVAHAARITATGAGGLTHQSAGLAVRDVHPTQFGRVCPVETPEGAAVGLVTSRASGASVDVHGFLSVPYLNLRTKAVEYMNAVDERRSDAVVIPYTTEPPKADEIVHARRGHNNVFVAGSYVTHAQVHPSQTLSISAACIPFLGHCDAQRALMGANMQRQALPVYGGEAPLVGTGMEREVIASSGHDVVASGSGTVCHVDADRIMVWYGDSLSVHRLSVFTPNNHTVASHTPKVSVGDSVVAGQTLATGLASDDGELAIGANLVVAYMPWHGYNFEDAVCIRESIVKNGVLTTVVSETFVTEARTLPSNRASKNEEITADMPDIAESDLANLDEQGIVRVGTYVKPGDILVGKVVPKPQDDVPDAVRLLQFVLGDVATPVKSEPLRYPAGSVSGVVTDVRVVRRIMAPGQPPKTEVERDTRLAKIEAERDTSIRMIRAKFRGQDNSERRYALIKDAKARYTESVKNLSSSDDLRPDVVCEVSVTVIRTLPLERGDKLALRYGSKGCVSIVVPDEDMPVMPDGRPIDVMLNPLGVPSRMNIGQIFEAHLGLAVWKLGEKVARMADEDRPTLDILSVLGTAYRHDKPALRRLFALGAKDRPEFLRYCRSLRDGIKVSTPPFNDVPEASIRQMLAAADQPTTGQLVLRDGQTGEPFEGPITVGKVYVLRLHHLAAKKMHARSTGPYSVSTQQPLGGQANFGGQRVGEMEVWALQAYGAAFTLNEMMTVKSDDTDGRKRAYRNMVKGDLVSLAERPTASSGLLINEMRGLCLDVQLLSESEAQAAEVEDVKAGRRASSFFGVSEDYYDGDETLTLKDND